MVRTRFQSEPLFGASPFSRDRPFCGHSAYLAFIDEQFDLDPAEIGKLVAMIESGASARSILQTLSESADISTRLPGEVARPISAEIHHFAKVI